MQYLSHNIDLCIAWNVIFIFIFLYNKQRIVLETCIWNILNVVKYFNFDHISLIILIKFFYLLQFTFNSNSMVSKIKDIFFL